MADTPTIVSTGVATGIVGLSTDGMLSLGSSGLAVTSMVCVDSGYSWITDDGGHPVTLTGVFLTLQSFSVTVIEHTDYSNPAKTHRCNSGKAGSRQMFTSTDGTTCVVYFPPLPRTAVGSKHTLKLESEDGIFTYTELDFVEVVGRDFATNLYSMRSSFPPPRQVGPYSIDEEGDPDG
jgi:hypothetical protein